MNWGSWALWGFTSTTVLSSLLAASQGMGWTRMNMPFLIGTVFTDDRDQAVVRGFFVHFLNGWLFALLYIAAFNAWGGPTWWKGAAVGFVHSFFVLTAGMGFLAAVHPRMATERHGPTVTRRLEPPGFMGLNYGLPTPVSIVLAHLVYGAILGAFYVSKHT